ncbi:cation diffusion facilitator family transporter [Shimazuella sp. AN120528]|uniref:cation diffusion facilitator family transporter n=1 Tax=Shimazuella soli TaxID=1892854 RepID=UPI001F0F6827|nr:cation diffusion facilitator family transporter [Shimazuella soli]MCH5584397.1 cation diffusion facilitator family transporter [Shimazuella soli]
MHNHSHSHHHDHPHHARNNNKNGLLTALLITAGIMILEFFGGLVTNSLALLSDSGHMLSDVSALALSLIAMWFASRPPSPRKTYGYYRFEILAALFNGVALFVIAGIIGWEAFSRMLEPPKVASGSMIVISIIGLIANLLSAWVLMRQGDTKENINLRSAYLHIIGDAIGSLGAIIAGILMQTFGWYIADPIISILVSILILKSAWGVVSHSFHILMEGTPVTIDQKLVKDVLSEISGVLNVHDLHIWTITSGFDSFSCHILIKEESESQSILKEAIQRLKERFHIQHTTIQIETVDFQHKNCQTLSCSTELSEK